jgi:hypothetical protein
MSNGTSIKIEKGVPMPIGRSTGITATLRAMEPGDSIFLPNGKHTNVRGLMQRVPSAKFTARTVEGGLRIWRLA